MQIDDALAKALLALFGASIGTTLWATFRAGQLSRSAERALRIATVVGGDENEAHDQRKRRGLIGIVEQIESIVTRNTRDIADISRRQKAVLRGMGLPSDLTDPERLEVMVKDRFTASSVRVDHTAARAALTEEQARRFAESESSVTMNARPSSSLIRPPTGPSDDPPPMVVQRRIPTRGPWSGKPPDTEVPPRPGDETDRTMMGVGPKAPTKPRR